MHLADYFLFGAGVFNLCSFDVLGKCRLIQSRCDFTSVCLRRLSTLRPAGLAVTSRRDWPTGASPSTGVIPSWDGRWRWNQDSVRYASERWLMGASDRRRWTPVTGLFVNAWDLCSASPDWALKLVCRMGLPDTDDGFDERRLQMPAVDWTSNEPHALDAVGGFSFRGGTSYEPQPTLRRLQGLMDGFDGLAMVWVSVVCISAGSTSTVWVADVEISLQLSESWFWSSKSRTINSDVAFGVGTGDMQICTGTIASVSAFGFEFSGLFSSNKIRIWSAEGAASTLLNWTGYLTDSTDSVFMRSGLADSIDFVFKGKGARLRDVDVCTSWLFNIWSSTIHFDFEQVSIWDGVCLHLLQCKQDDVSLESFIVGWILSEIGATSILSGCDDFIWAPSGLSDSTYCDSNFDFGRSSCNDSIVLSTNVTTFSDVDVCAFLVLSPDIRSSLDSISFGSNSTFWSEVGAVTISSGCVEFVWVSSGPSGDSNVFDSVLSHCIASIESVISGKVARLPDVDVCTSWVAMLDIWLSLDSVIFGSNPTSWSKVGVAPILSGRTDFVLVLGFPKSTDLIVFLFGGWVVGLVRLLVDGVTLIFVFDFLFSIGIRHFLQLELSTGLSVILFAGTKILHCAFGFAAGDEDLGRFFDFDLGFDFDGDFGRIYGSNFISSAVLGLAITSRIGNWQRLQSRVFGIWSTIGKFGFEFVEAGCTTFFVVPVGFWTSAFDLKPTAPDVQDRLHLHDLGSESLHLFCIQRQTRHDFDSSCFWFFRFLDGSTTFLSISLKFCARHIAATSVWTATLALSKFRPAITLSACRRLEDSRNASNAICAHWQPSTCSICFDKWINSSESTAFRLMPSIISSMQPHLFSHFLHAILDLFDSASFAGFDTPCWRIEWTRTYNQRSVRQL